MKSLSEPDAVGWGSGREAGLEGKVGLVGRAQAQVKAPAAVPLTQPQGFDIAAS